MSYRRKRPSLYFNFHTTLKSSYPYLIHYKPYIALFSYMTNNYVNLDIDALHWFINIPEPKARFRRFTVLTHTPGTYDGS